jgi:hypothetical protein
MSDVAIGVGVGVGVGGVVLVLLVVWRCVVVFKQDRPLGELSLVNHAEAEQYVTDHREEWLAADEQLFVDAPTWRLRKSAPVNADGINLTVRERADPSGNPNNLFRYYAETSIPIAPRVACKLFGSWVSARAMSLRCVALDASFVDSALTRVDQRSALDATSPAVSRRVRGVGSVSGASLYRALLWRDAASAGGLLRDRRPAKWRRIGLVPFAA